MSFQGFIKSDFTGDSPTKVKTACDEAVFEIQHMELLTNNSAERLILGIVFTHNAINSNIS